jgi:PAS domain S-box-containing protein
MTHKTDNRRKTDPERHKTASDNHSRSTQALLDRIDELQGFYDFSPVGFLTLDPKGRLLDINLTAVIMLRDVRSELIGQSFYAYVEPEDRDILYFHLRSLFKREKPQRCELRIQNADDKIIHTTLDSIYAEDRKGRRVCRSVMIDITERIQSEQALRDSEEQLRIAVECGRLGTWDRNLITDETTWNRYLYDLFGRDPNRPAITGDAFFSYIHPDDIERVRRSIAETFQTGIDFIDEFRIIREDGEVRWLAASGRLYRDQKGRPVRMAGVNYDITDRKRMEETLRRSREELEIRVRERTANLQKRTDELQELTARLQSLNERAFQEHGRRIYLSKRLVEILEKERREIAMALHDEAGQTLTTLKMDLEMMEDATDLLKQSELLHSAKGKISKLTEFIKNISRQLRPSVLDTLGLLSAVRSLIDQLREDRVEFEIDLITKVVPERLDHNKETALFRILQEALNNCIKYADAKKVHISLVEKNKAVLLTVEDDGKGFDYEKVSMFAEQGRGPLGITIMRERAVQQGGTFWVESAPGRGTFISVEVPI